MSKSLSLFWICLTSLLIGWDVHADTQPQKMVQTQHDFQVHVFNWIKKCIEQNPLIPQKSELNHLIKSIQQNQVVIEKGNDDLRVKFVNAQGYIEHVLACMQVLGDIHELVGIIHTPMPATPLCTKQDHIDQTLLSDSIRSNKEKLWTVRSRAQVVRDYLHKGGKLYVVYPKGGYEKRSAEQQLVYKEELNNFQSNLIDFVLNTDEMDPEMIGASYFFRNSQNQRFFFSIKAHQANDPQNSSEWAIWFGPVEHPQIAERIQTLFHYFERVKGPEKTLFFPS